VNPDLADLHSFLFKQFDDSILDPKGGAARFAVVTDQRFLAAGAIE